VNTGAFGQPNVPGVELTVMEAFHFLMNHWTPRDVLAGLAFERPYLLKPLDHPPGASGLELRRGWPADS